MSTAYGAGGSGQGTRRDLGLTMSDGKPAIVINVEYEEFDYGGPHSPAHSVPVYFCIGPAYSTEEPIMR